MYKKYVVCVVFFVLMLALAGCVQTPTENGEETDPSLSNVLDAGVLTVGSDIPYPPMENFSEDGNIIGFDIDVVVEIAQRLGVSYDVIDYNWTDIFDAVASGEVDIIISSITIDPSREEEYGILFSIAYFRSGQVVVTNASNQDITHPQNLSGLKVGVQINTTSMDEALKYTSNESFVLTYDSYESKGIISDLKNGIIDAIIVDYPVAIDIVQKNPSLKIATNLFTDELFGIATKEGNVALINAINEIIKEMQQDGTLDSIEAKWTEI